VRALGDPITPAAIEAAYLWLATLIEKVTESGVWVYLVCL